MQVQNAYVKVYARGGNCHQGVKRVFVSTLKLSTTKPTLLVTGQMMELWSLLRQVEELRILIYV